MFVEGAGGVYKQLRGFVCDVEAGRHPIMERTGAIAGMDLHPVQIGEGGDLVGTDLGDGGLPGDQDLFQRVDRCRWFCNSAQHSLTLSEGCDTRARSTLRSSSFCHGSSGFRPACRG